MREPDLSRTCGFRQKLSIHLYFTLAKNRRNRQSQFFTKFEKPQKKGQKRAKKRVSYKKRPFLRFFQKSDFAIIFFYFFPIFPENFRKIHQTVLRNWTVRLQTLGDRIFSKFLIFKKFLKNFGKFFGHAVFTRCSHQ